jgi:hypothetical protein
MKALVAFSLFFSTTAIAGVTIDCGYEDGRGVNILFSLEEGPAGGSWIARDAGGRELSNAVLSQSVDGGLSLHLQQELNHSLYLGENLTPFTGVAYEIPRPAEGGRFQVLARQQGGLFPNAVTGVLECEAGTN